MHGGGWQSKAREEDKERQRERRREIEREPALQAIALYVPSLEMKEVRDGGGGEECTRYCFYCFYVPSSFFFAPSVRYLGLFTFTTFVSFLPTRLSLSLFLIRPAYVI